MDKIKQMENWCAAHYRKVLSRQILQAVLLAHHFTFQEMCSQSKKEHVQARRCFVWFCKHLTRLSNEKAGQHVKRAGSTTTYQVNKTDELIAASDTEMIDALWRVFITLKQLQREKI